MKKVYCIIVTYNGMQWIDRCLQSLLNSTFEVSVIVIDNGSKDQTVSYINKNYPAIRFIQSERNLGFGQGNNVGLKIALDEDADYVFLLNQDAWVESDSIEKLINALEAHPEYGIISPIHLNGAGTNFDDHFINYLLQSDIKDLMWSNVRLQSFNATVINTTFVNAAAWLISKSCLLKVGGFDPIFFHYGEDDNYGQRVIYKGYKIGILPGSVIYHDKERPALNKTENIRKAIGKEWIQFLVYACNINDDNYKGLIIKKGLRHIARLAAALITFRKIEIIYNYSLAVKSFSSFGRIKQSRQISKMDAVAPYLQ